MKKVGRLHGYFIVGDTKLKMVQPEVDPINSILPENFVELIKDKVEFVHAVHVGR